jgi:hypothetical protein
MQRIGLAIAISMSFAAACGGESKSAESPDCPMFPVFYDVHGEALDARGDITGDAGPLWESIPILPGDAFLTRKAAYFDHCFSSNGPGQGGIYGQVCRVAGGADDYNVVEIEKALEKVGGRLDTADFRVAALIRMLLLDRETGALPDDLRDSIEETLLNFRYWFSEPGDDKMCYWTENHQILFHSGELLAGQLFPEAVFPNSGMTGAEHVAHALPLLDRWLDFRGRMGFSEWHSNVYFNEDIPALVNLVDFAEDEKTRTKAAMVLDIVLMDLLNNMYKGNFATTHGRTYSSKFLNGLQDSTSEAAWLCLGLGEMGSAGNFSATFLATSKYVPPVLIEEIAQKTSGSHEHRQRDSISVTDAASWGLTYEGMEDVVFWAGLSALVAPEVINGTVGMLDEYDLWNGFLFGDIPEPFDSMLKQMAGTPELEQLATEMEVVARGIALESVNTYTYRTPHYQLSGAQDTKAGYWAAQTQMWQATLDRDAYVLTSFPGKMDDLEAGLEFGDQWIGGWLPRVTLHRNVGVIQYRKDSVPMLDDYLTADYLHAFFPRAGFDEVVEVENWVMGRKGDGYLALGSQHPVYWVEDSEYELRTDVTENTWIVELGSAEEWGGFEGFVAAIGDSALSFEDGVAYDSPSQGMVQVGWKGPMEVAEQNVDLGPFLRWDNDFCVQEFGSGITVVVDGETRLRLDFDSGVRQLEVVATTW